jgi:hypothetical protein
MDNIYYILHPGSQVVRMSVAWFCGFAWRTAADKSAALGYDLILNRL